MSKQDYPKAKKVDYSYTVAGHVITDPYNWMEANDEDTKAFVAVQNRFTDDWFRQNANASKRAEKLKEEAGKPSYSGAVECHGKIYATRTDSDGSVSAVLLDTRFQELETLRDEAMSGGEYHVYGVSPSPATPNYLAYFVLKNGAARPSVLIQDKSSGEIIGDLDGIFSYCWSLDGKTLIFADAVADAEAGVNLNTVRGYDVETRESRLLYTEPDHAVFLKVAAAPDNSMFIHSCRTYSATKLIHMSLDTLEPVVITGGAEADCQYLGTIGERHYIYTDENAPQGRIVAVDGALNWEQAAVIIPEDTGRRLEGAGIMEEKVLAVYLHDVVSEAQVFDSNGKLTDTLTLPDKMGSLTAMMPLAYGPGSNRIYMNFESFTCPPSVVCYDLAKGELSTVYVCKEGKEAGNVSVRQEFITARDGQKIMAFLVHRDDVSPNGEVPALMYGYGGYGASMPPWYNNPFMGLDILDWVQKGGLYVHCVLRGGGEYGTHWHDAGKLKTKKNAFYDAIDIAEWLVVQKWTRPEKIAINGGSNGGLLVTAMVTLRPDLFGAVIASVPHTDMIRFCFDDRGPMYITEYGDPREEGMFEYMYSYSPYHNIKEAVNYPPIYVQTGEFDNNVPPYHGKKFATRMQEYSAGGPCLLRVLARGSHDRGTGDVYYQTCAEMQTFAEYALGMDQE